MINVLPLEYKSSLKKEFYARAIILALVLFSLLGIIFSALLAPSYILIKSREHTALLKESALKDAALASGSKVETDTVKKINSTLSLFLVKEPSISPSELLLFVVGALPKGITIDQIHISKVGKMYQVVLSGFASDRDTLLSFSDLLKNDSRIANLELPLSNFISNQNLEFNMTLSTIPI